jgi:glutamate synthase domain-containing protein 1
MRQFFVARGDACEAGISFERKLYIVRRLSTHRIRYSGEDEDALFYIGSLSSRTMTYKGMLTTEQLEHYFPDLSDEAMDSALALTHSRFSTNTFRAGRALSLSAIFAIMVRSTPFAVMRTGSTPVRCNSPVKYLATI